MDMERFGCLHYLVCLLMLIEYLSISILQRPHHIHTCFRNSLSSSKRVVQYCYSHMQWFTDNTDWNDHCRTHLLNPDLFCGIVSFRGITGLAGICPFCMSDSSKSSPARQFQQFQTTSGFTFHLKQHIIQIHDHHSAIACPHISCNQDCSSVTKLLYHFYDIHSIDEAKALLRALKEHTSELLISSHEVLEHSAIRSTVYRPRLCPNYEDQITDVSPIADIDQTADVTPTSETSSLSPTSDSGLPTALSDCPISPSPNLGTLDASITSSSGGGMKRKASNSDTTRHSKQRKRQLDMICESKILPTGQLPDGREYICSAFILPGYGTDLFMIAMDLRRLLGYTHSRCLFGNPYDPRPTLVPEAAVSYLKDQSLLPQAYSRRNLSLVKAFDMFRKFGHRVILNGAPHLPTINGDLVDAAPDSSRSSPVPRTACPTISNLSEPVTPHPSIEESTLPKITARKTKKPKPKPKPKSQARSPSEEMENRNRVIRLHAGYSKDGVVAGANSRYL